MKKTIITNLTVGFFFAVTASSVFAQGRVFFNTFGNANTALGRTFMSGGFAPGSAHLGQLWWSDSTNGVFTALGPPQPFSNATPYFIQDGIVTIPGREAGTTVFIQLRVWNASAAPDWCGAMGAYVGANGWLLRFGITASISLILGGTNSVGDVFSTPQFNNFPNLTLNDVCIDCGPPYKGYACTPLLSFARTGNNVMLSWSNGFILQSATNLAGIYSDVATNNFYTNNTSSSAQRFFRLRN